MIGHIFKKDWKLLWHFFALVAVLQFLVASIRLKLGLFGGDPTLDFLLTPAVIISMMGIAFLVVVIVHQDPIPGVSQDWLVRPLHRKDLLLAKLLFGVVLLQSAIFAADFFQILASGFPFGQSMVGAFSHNVYLLAIVTLPALAIASVTRNMTQAIIGAGIAFCVGTGIEIMAVLAKGGQNYLYQTSGGGPAWIGKYCGQLMIVAGVCLILWLQYFRRRTRFAWWLIGVTLSLFILAQFLPWSLVFALQQRFSPRPGAAHAIAMEFNPGVGRFQQLPGAAVSEESPRHSNEQDTGAEVALPLSITGLRDGMVLKVDQADIRIIDSSGKVLYRNYGEDWEVHREGATSDTPIPTYQKMSLSGPMDRRLKQQPLRLEIEYSLTLSRLDSTYRIPAVGGIQRDSKLGLCETQLNDAGTFVELRCIQPGNSSSCRLGYLENDTTGVRNPPIFACDPEYAPSFERSNKDPMSHFGLNLSFHDPAGLVHYPVDGPQLLKSQVMVSVYKPEDHFTRRLVIPAIRLTAWETK